MQQVHPVLGISRPAKEWPHRCSLCSETIPADHIPLRVWATPEQKAAGWIFREYRAPEYAGAWFFCAECAVDVGTRLNADGELPD